MDEPLSSALVIPSTARGVSLGIACRCVIATSLLSAMPLMTLDAQPQDLRGVLSVCEREQNRNAEPLESASAQPGELLLLCIYVSFERLREHHCGLNPFHWNP